MNAFSGSAWETVVKIGGPLLGLAIIAAAVRIALGVWRQAPTPGGPARVRRKLPLSMAEISLYRHLARGCPARYLLVAPAPLASFLRFEGRLDETLAETLEEGAVDFLLLHPTSGEPLLAIELDDSTNDTPAARYKDRHEAELLERARVPLFRTRLGSKWAEELEEAVLNAVNPLA